MVSTIHEKLSMTTPKKTNSTTISNFTRPPKFNLKRGSKSALALAAFLNPIFPSAHIDGPPQGQTLYNCLGCKIAHLRKEKGWYQKDLAHAAGISTSYISRLERGYHIEGVTLDILLRITEVFDISLGQLFTYTKDEITIAHYREELHKYC